MSAVLALLSAALWGSADYVAGRLSRTQHVLAVLWLTQLVGLAIMIGPAVARSGWAAPTGYLPWAVLASLSGATGLALYYRALAVGTMGVVSPIAALGVIVPLLIGLLAGERPSQWQDLGIVLALAGVVAASGPEIRGETGWRPVALAAGSALFLGTAMVAIARGSAVDLVMTMTAMRVVTVCALGVLVLARSIAVRPPARHLPALVGVGAFDIGANLAFGAAASLGMLSLVAVFGSLYPVATIVLAWWLDHERMRAVQYSGVALALTGAALISAG